MTSSAVWLPTAPQEKTKKEDEGFRKSDIIALGTGLGVGIPSLVIAAVALYMQLRKRGNAAVPSSETLTQFFPKPTTITTPTPPIVAHEQCVFCSALWLAPASCTRGVFVFAASDRRFIFMTTKPMAKSATTPTIAPMTIPAIAAPPRVDDLLEFELCAGVEVDMPDDAGVEVAKEEAIEDDELLIA
ncbi:hypothetical protein EK21DRAFT_94553 [Setomelanomma holmii]|uniref:Uncharacterized protein n=1 Tax=Setomelanomma holmii TaxID=210430 RepID=A0A9P4GXM4_9PLEO|nr:hypothetical protein EK21DRAFT_94553 [Setomelanomma holmii]